MKKIKPKRQRAFTLIELLVVLVVISIVIGMVSVQFMPDNRSMLRDEAQRLALLLENAGMEARSSGLSMAWSSLGNGYCFWKKNDYGDWVKIDNDAIFRARTLPDGMKISNIQVESLPLKSDEKLALSAATFPLPYVIRLSIMQERIGIKGSSTGAVTLDYDDEK